MAPTVEGELLRAINKIVYRYYNDGDYFWCGYGCETTGPAHAYLTQDNPIATKMYEILIEATGVEDAAYEAVLNVALDAVLTYIEGRNGQTTPNTKNMWDMKPVYDNYAAEDDEEDEDW
jgi:hypothetical protein